MENRINTIMSQLNFKRGLSEDLPVEREDSTLFYTVDTKQMFIGETEYAKKEDITQLEFSMEAKQALLSVLQIIVKDRFDVDEAIEDLAEKLKIELPQVFFNVTINNGQGINLIYDIPRVKAKTSYYNELEIDEGFKLNTITVLMSGQDITNESFNQEEQTISVPHVMGELEIVITSKALININDVIVSTVVIPSLDGQKVAAITNSTVKIDNIQYTGGSFVNDLSTFTTYYDTLIYNNDYTEFDDGSSITLKGIGEYYGTKIIPYEIIENGKVQKTFLAFDGDFTIIGSNKTITPMFTLPSPKDNGSVTNLYAKWNNSSVQTAFGLIGRMKADANGTNYRTSTLGTSEGGIMVAYPNCTNEFEVVTTANTYVYRGAQVCAAGGNFANGAYCSFALRSSNDYTSGVQIAHYDNFRIYYKYDLEIYNADISIDNENNISVIGDNGEYIIKYIDENNNPLNDFGEITTITV